MAEFTTDLPLTKIFTPPASCNSHWTYESENYNSVDGGLLIQNAFADIPDTDCFPTGFEGFGRAPSVVAIYTPGACPVGYATAGNSFNGATTTAICCPSAFSYMFTYSSVNYFSSSALYAGCISTYNMNRPTTVLARSNNADLNTTVVNGPITMWAQPISVAFRSQDLTLFTTTTTSSKGTSTSVAPSSTSTLAPKTTASTSSSATSVPTAAPTINPPSPTLSGGAIAGIAIGCAAVLGLLIGLALFFRRRKHSHKSHDDSSPTYPVDAKFSPASPEGVESRQNQAELDGGWHPSEMQGQGKTGKQWIPTSPVEVE